MNKTLRSVVDSIARTDAINGVPKENGWIRTSDYFKDEYNKPLPIYDEGKAEYEAAYNIALECKMVFSEIKLKTRKLSA